MKGSAGLAAAVQRFDQEAGERLRLAGICQIVADAGMAAVERAGRRFVAVALLRHGDRDDAGSGAGEAVEHGGRIFRRHQRFGDRADDAEPVAGRIPDGHGVKAILRGERIAGVGAAQRNAADAPRAGGAVETIVGVDGLMSTMECAKADMDDAGFQAGAGSQARGFAMAGASAIIVRAFRRWPVVVVDATAFPPLPLNPGDWPWDPWPASRCLLAH